MYNFPREDSAATTVQTAVFTGVLMIEKVTVDSIAVTIVPIIIPKKDKAAILSRTINLLKNAQKIRVKLKLLFF